MVEIFGAEAQAALGDWMDARGLGSGPFEDISALAGGTQNVLLRFRRGTREFVLRRPPVHPRANSNTTMLREARVLRAIGGSPVPHPGLIASCDDESVLGVCFYLMEPVDGFNPTSGLPALHAGDAMIQRAMGFGMIEALAALGEIDHEAVGLGDFGKPDHYLERQVSRWGSQLASYTSHAGWPGPRSLPGVDKVAAWLETHRPAHFRPGIIHGDFHLANVMFRHDGPHVAAVIDWELTTIGDPLLDLGWLLSTWPGEAGPTAATVEVTPWVGFPSREELVEDYRGRSSRDLSAIDWYATLACYKFGIILEGTFARALSGEAEQDVGNKLHAAAVAHFERALELIR